MIVGISGLIEDSDGNRKSAGAGKDAVCKRLVDRHGFQNVGFADVMKRFVQEVFDFSDEQVWGSNEQKERADARYPMSLTPRRALQTLGTDWGRNMCWSDMWVAYAMRVANKIEAGNTVYDPKLGCRYHAEVGSVMTTRKHVCFNDVRFKNEFDAIRAEGGKVIRVRRPALSTIEPTTHQSEIDLLDIPDDAFDYVIQALPDDLSDLYEKVDQMVQELVPARSVVHERIKDLLELLPADHTDQLADAIELKLKQHNIDPQNMVVVSHVMTFNSESVIQQEELPVQYEEHPFVGAALDSRLVPEDHLLHTFLVAREKDVELGLIRPYNEEQKDIPPFMRDADAGASKVVYNIRAIRKLEMYGDEESAQHVDPVIHESVCKTAEYPVTDALKPADDQCCLRDHDHDGNCDVHSSKGELRSRPPKR